jgi:hypothetical protein
MPLTYVSAVFYLILIWLTVLLAHGNMLRKLHSLMREQLLYSDFGTTKQKKRFTFVNSVSSRIVF